MQSPFHIPWKHTFGFLMFSVGLKQERYPEID